MDRPGAFWTASNGWCGWAMRSSFRARPSDPSGSVLPAAAWPKSSGCAETDRLVLERILRGRKGLRLRRGRRGRREAGTGGEGNKTGERGVGEEGGDRG